MNAFHSKEDLLVELSENDKNLILSCFAVGTTIEESYYFDNYNLPCPIKVKVLTPDEGSKFVVLRKARHGDVNLEATVLTLLSKYGLPAPKVLAGPKDDALVLSFLEGESLQHFSMNSKDNIEKAMALLNDALTTLESVTEQISQDAGEILPHYTLLDELNPIQNKSLWNSEKLFNDAVDILLPVLQQISTPLIFTNGDYQPGNFMTDGEKITGFIDFEKAQLRDPLMGLAKYPVYDLQPLNKAGFVDIYLNAHGFSEKDFAIRVALFCLITLQKEIPLEPTNDEDKEYQKRVLELLEYSLKEIK